MLTLFVELHSTIGDGQSPRKGCRLQKPGVTQLVDVHTLLNCFEISRVLIMVFGAALRYSVCRIRKRT